jgi:hypothetical protein
MHDYSNTREFENRGGDSSYTTDIEERVADLFLGRPHIYVGQIWRRQDYHTREWEVIGLVRVEGEIKFILWQSVDSDETTKVKIRMLMQQLGA